MAALRFASWLPLGIGLVLGGAVVTLFTQSLSAPAGSPEEKVQRLEVELKRANNRIASLEGDPRRGKRGPRNIMDGARDLADDIREGRPVSPDDILRASQPLLRDLAPLFDRMRKREQQQTIERLSGELVRKYDLNPAQRQQLQEWFARKLDGEQQRWNELLTKDGTRLEDLVRASRGTRPDDGIDPVMEKMLSGQKLADFKSERMTERAKRVQQDADARVERLDSMVQLDDRQREQVFGIMARGSRDYDPAMRIEGISGNGTGPAVSKRQEAMLAVLTPAQRAAYDADRERRRQEAAKQMEAVGLTMPAGWDVLDPDDF